MSPRDLPRRDFLKALGVGLAATGPLALLNAGCATGPHRPNIVFVLTDDHAHDALGCAGHPWIRTPALDRLAGEGVRFSNAFVTSSLCSPSRASFLSGLYPHTHGVCSNEVDDLPAATPSFPRLLQQAGYTTAFIGKWHMARTARPRPGFDHWVSFNGQGDYNRNTLYANGRWELSHRYITDELTDRSARFLEQTSGDTPFMLMLSHKAVHQPFQPAPRHADLYATAPVANDLPRGDRLDLKPDWGGRRREPDPEGFLRNYARTLAAVDEGLGRVMATLEKSGQLDNTVIIYAGDNGFMMGEHGGLWDKRAAYERSMRVPLLVRYPDRFGAGVVCDEPALNIDVMPTILQMAGVTAPASLPGLCLSDLADGAVVREGFLYEYFHELGPVPTTVALRTKRYKYITYPENPDLPRELYDLRYDPDELLNRAGDDTYADLLRDLDARLELQKTRTGFRMMKPTLR